MLRARIEKMAKGIDPDKYANFLKSQKADGLKCLDLSETSSASSSSSSSYDSPPPPPPPPSPIRKKKKCKSKGNKKKKVKKITVTIPPDNKNILEDLCTPQPLENDFFPSYEEIFPKHPPPQRNDIPLDLSLVKTEYPPPQIEVTQVFSPVIVNEMIDLVHNLKAPDAPMNEADKARRQIQEAVELWMWPMIGQAKRISKAFNKHMSAIENNELDMCTNCSVHCVEAALKDLAKSNRSVVKEEYLRLKNNKQALMKTHLDVLLANKHSLEQRIIKLSKDIETDTAK